MLRPLVLGLMFAATACGGPPWSVPVPPHTGVAPATDYEAASRPVGLSALMADFPPSLRRAATCRDGDSVRHDAFQCRIDRHDPLISGLGSGDALSSFVAMIDHLPGQAQFERQNPVGTVVEDDAKLVTVTCDRPVDGWATMRYLNTRTGLEMWYGGFTGCGSPTVFLARAGL